MVRSITVIILSALLSMAALTSCGTDESLGGNVTEFTTSYATAQSSQARLEANLITGNTCTGGVSAGGTVETENVNFSVNVVSTTKGSVVPLPLAITGYTVSFAAKNVGAPAIADLTSDYNTIITPGSSASIPVAVVTDKLKIELLTADPGLACSLSIYQYDVTVKFHAAEVGSTKPENKTIAAGMVVAIADRAN